MITKLDYHELRYWDEWHRLMAVTEENAGKKKGDPQKKFVPFEKKSREYLHKMLNKILESS